MLCAFAAAAFDFAGAVNGFVDLWIALVVDGRRPGDLDVQLICNVDIDSRDAFAVNHAARRVQVVRIDFPGAAAVDIDDLGGAGNVDGWRSGCIDLKLVVVHAFDLDVPGARNRKTLEIGNRDPKLHRLARRVLLRAPQAQHVVRHFRRHESEGDYGLILY